MDINARDQDNYFGSNKDEQNQTFKGRGPQENYDSVKNPEEEKLTQYFEDLAAKALDLTKKYGLKDEFEMIKGEIKKHEIIKKGTSSPGDDYFEDTYSSDELSDDSFELKKVKKEKTRRRRHRNYEKPKKIPRQETPDYERHNRRKLVLQKGEVPPHERLYTQAVKSRIQKSIKQMEESSPQSISKKYYPHVIRQYELAKKLNKEKEYPCKRDEEIEDEIECTFHPKIKKSQRAVQGRRNAPIFAPLYTEEQKREKVEKRIEEELEGCTFKPELCKRSLRMADHVMKKKQEEDEREAKKKEDIILMKNTVEKKVTNKASMFFDVHSNKAQERLEREKLNIHSRHTTQTQNEDIYEKRVLENMMTPDFEHAHQPSDELPVLPERDGPESDQEDEEDEDIERMIKQVIFDQDFNSGSQFSALGLNQI